jgi:type I restriction enzyme S subunit
MEGYMYILQCADGSYYTGSTTNLELRLQQHQNGEGANHTRKHLPVKLVYFEEFDRIDKAFYREKQVQGWSRKKKEALINGQLDQLHDLAACKNETHYRGFGSAQPPKDDSAQPPKDDTAQPPKDDTALPPKDDSAQPPKDGSAQPKKERFAKSTNDDTALPPKPRSLSGAETKGASTPLSPRKDPLSPRVPELRFREFNGKWNEYKLGDLLEFKNGINAEKEQYGSGVRFINVLDILENEFITYEKIIGSINVGTEIVEKYPVNYGDILFQRSSETRDEVGTACVYLDKNRTATFGGFVIRGKKVGDYNPIFLNKLLKTNCARKEITSKSGGSTRYNVGQETLSSVLLRYPSLPEQQKIAAFLTLVDDKIQKLTRKKELLEQYKKGVMQQLFPSAGSGTPKLRFKIENEAGELVEPPDWEEKKLGEVLKESRIKGDGGDVAKKITVKLWGKGVFEKEEKIQGSAQTQYFIRKSGQFIYSKLDFLNCAFGVIPDNLDGYQSTVDLPCFDIDENISPTFLLEIIKQKDFYKRNGETADGSRKAKRIHVNTFLNFNIQLPCFEEQQKIASFLSGIDIKIERTGVQLEKVREWKKGLLQKMFV